MSHFNSKEIGTYFLNFITSKADYAKCSGFSFQENIKLVTQESVKYSYSIASMLEKSLCKLRVEKEPKNRLENDPVKEPRGQQFGIQNRSSYC